MRESRLSARQEALKQFSDWELEDYRRWVGRLLDRTRKKRRDRFEWAVGEYFRINLEMIRRGHLEDET